MSIPDSVIVDYFTLGTNVDAADVDAVEQALSDGSLHPMEAKKRLAHAIVAEWHDTAAADHAAERFDTIHSKREVPDEMPEVALAFEAGVANVLLADLLTEAGIVPSKGEVKRLVAQGAIRLNDDPVSDARISVRPGSVLKIGKRRWLRLVEE